MVRGRCSICTIVKDRDQYGKKNWKKGDRRRCRSCAKSNADESFAQRPTKKQKRGSETSPAETAAAAAVDDDDAPLSPSFSSTANEEPKTLSLEALSKRMEKQDMRMEKQNMRMEKQEMEQKKASQEVKKARQEAKKARNEAKKAKKDIANLRASKSHKGVTTQAQFRDDLSNQGLLRLSEATTVWGKFADWPLKEAAEVPEEGTKEAGEEVVQAIVSDVLKKLKACKDAQSDKWVSEPDPDAFRKSSFRTRKPDIVNYKKGMTGSLAITSFGDVKKRGSGDFASDEVGHVLDMARSFMEHVGMYRPFLIVFLTDGKRWQFFRVTRDAEKSGGYDYQQQETVINDAVTGWKHYMALLTSELPDLGYSEPAINGVDLMLPLGRGGSAVVYKGKYKENVVLVKVFSSNMASSYYAEKKALGILHGVQGVPQVEACLQLTESIKGVCSTAIVATPIGIAFAPREGGSSVNGKHLKELVRIVSEAHERSLLHRDIKPDNIYLSDDSMLLNDWSSAETTFALNPVWEGTFGFSVSQQEDPTGMLSGKVRDLMSVVRTAYSLLFQEMPPSDDASAIKYWNVRIQQDTYWAKAVKYAKALKYDKLGKLLEKMK